MKQIFLIQLLLACTLTLNAQTKSHGSSVGILIDDSVFVIEPQQTQTEIKSGWKIVDFQTKDRVIRYLWGRHSRQYADSPRPRIILNPGISQVIEYAIIRLNERRDHRRFPDSSLRKCDYHTFDLFYADVAPYDDDRFIIQPKEDLQPGEYCILQLTQQPFNDTGDIIVYPFTIDHLPWIGEKK